MKIGIMLRHYDQHGGGVKIYTQNLLDHILKLNNDHEYVFFYRNPKAFGTYSHFKQVKEIVLNAPLNFMWDQISVPLWLKQKKIDILFNPKYSIPLSGSEKKIFVCHGLDWFVMPWGSKYADRLNHKMLFPRFCEKADRIIAVSETVKKHLITYLNIPKEKIKTIHLAVDESFGKPINSDFENDIKLKYKLPQKYFLYVGQIYPPKNFGRILQAFAKAGPQNGFKLVVAGEHRWLCDEEIKLIEKLRLKDSVIWTGWIENKNLPILYKSAEALLFPSLYEGFGIPNLEAMTAGCPIITSNRFATKEISDGAAILVDPENVDCIAQGMFSIMNNYKLRNELLSFGFERAKQFSWNKCAIETLQVLEQTAVSEKIVTPKRKQFLINKYAS